MSKLSIETQELQNFKIIAEEGLRSLIKERPVLPVEGEAASADHLIQPLTLLSKMSSNVQKTLQAVMTILEEQEARIEKSENSLRSSFDYLKSEYNYWRLTLNQHTDASYIFFTDMYPGATLLLDDDIDFDENKNIESIHFVPAKATDESGMLPSHYYTFTKAFSVDPGSIDPVSNLNNKKQAVVLQCISRIANDTNVTQFLEDSLSGPNGMIETGRGIAWHQPSLAKPSEQEMNGVIVITMKKPVLMSYLNFNVSHNEAIKGITLIDDKQKMLKLPGASELFFKSTNVRQIQIHIQDVFNSEPMSYILNAFIIALPDNITYVHYTDARAQELKD